MSWWNRHRMEPPARQPAHESDRDLDAELKEADRAIAKARQQKREQFQIGKALREVRERNHFAELFRHDGMGA